MSRGERGSLAISVGITILFAVFLWKFAPDFSLNPSLSPGRDVLQVEVEAVEIPVAWGNMGKRMADAGVFDRAKIIALYGNRGGLDPEELKLIDGMNSGPLKMTRNNSGLILNLLWGFGLANKNDILLKGEMMDPQFAGAENFASTGGWSLAMGHPMDHYSMHKFMELTPEEQEKVARTSQGIFRPCCGNSTHFPDCNHGMAMLGLLQMLAKNGADEAEMYRTALAVNRLWFPSQYKDIDRYLQDKGALLDSVDPKIVLGSVYSSANGYQRILAAITPAPKQPTSCGA
jgi:hypothetical protein